jgi:hypothetical protein
MALAFELSSKTLAIEALAMACCRHDPNVWDDQRLDVSSMHSPKEILDLISKETAIHSESLDAVFRDYRRLIMKHRDSLDTSNPRQLLEQLQRLAVSLQLDSMKGGKPDDHFSVLVAASHAVRVLIPLTPAKLQLSLLLQLWQLILAAYLLRSRTLGGPAPGRPCSMENLIEAACADNDLDAWTLASIRVLKLVQTGKAECS